MTTSIVKRSNSQSFESGGEEVSRPPLRAVRGKKSIEQWITERANDPDKEGALVALVLEHLVGSAGEVLHEKKVGQNPLDIPATAKLIYDIAQTFCQDLTGNHLFRIQAFYDGNPQPQAKHIFAIAGQQDTEFLGQESPDQKGLLAHGLGYSSKTMELALRQMQLSNEIMNENARIMANTVSRLTAENFQAFEALKNFLVEREMAKGNREFENLKYQRASAEREKYISMALPLLNQLTGRKIVPTTTEDSQIIESISKLDGATLTKMLTALQSEPALLATVASRLDEIIGSDGKVDHSREEKLAKSLPAEDDFETLPAHVDEPVVVQQQPDERDALIAELKSKNEASDIELAHHRQLVTELQERMTALETPVQKATIKKATVKKVPTKKGKS
jgi:hypothetical protein